MLFWTFEPFLCALLWLCWNRRSLEGTRHKFFWGMFMLMMTTMKFFLLVFFFFEKNFYPIMSNKFFFVSNDKVLQRQQQQQQGGLWEFARSLLSHWLSHIIPIISPNKSQHHKLCKKYKKISLSLSRGKSFFILFLFVFRKLCLLPSWRDSSEAEKILSLQSFAWATATFFMSLTLHLILSVAPIIMKSRLFRSYATCLFPNTNHVIALDVPIAFNKYQNIGYKS